jgi:aryl-alcohol dehydrogenase-like predicted oxidoreductase
LEVSRLALGAIPFGSWLDEKESRNLADMFLDAGGNFVDTANIYGGGNSERTVGKIIKGRRDHFVVGTKGAWLVGNKMRPNAFGLSRTYLATHIEASLRQLETDYIDLYQCHVQDPYTPIEETMRVLDDFVRAGKIRYVGVSNWGGWQVVKANTYARQFALSPVVSNQIWYSLADRVAEFAIIPACRDQRVSIIAWGALAQGFLTGRYRRGDNAPPPDSRTAGNLDDESSSWKRLAVERNWNTLDVLERIAERHDKTIPSVAIAWLLQSGTCDVVLVGARNREQYTDNMAVLNLRLSEEEMQELKAVSELPAPYPMNFWNAFCYRESKYYGGHR